MSADIIPIRPRESTIDAWEDYCALLRQRDDCPALATDLEHCKSVIRAWRRWSDLFLASEPAA